MLLVSQVNLTGQKLNRMCRQSQSPTRTRFVPAFTRRFQRSLCLVFFILACSLCPAGNEPVVLQRILFGSCNKNYKPQPLWKPILANRPDLWIWLGDIVYADTEDMREMRKKYDSEKHNANYEALRRACKII